MAIKRIREEPTRTVFVNPYILQTQYNTSRGNIAAGGFRRLFLAHLAVEDGYIYCDLCGTHVSAGDNTRMTLSSVGGADWQGPEGWTSLGNLNLCPSCAAVHDAVLQSGAGSEASAAAEAGLGGRPRAEVLEPQLPEPVLREEEAERLAVSPDGVLQIPAGTRSIGARAFMYRADIRQVVLPDSVEHLGPFAFACTSLESFSAPDGLVSIGDKAFYLCRQLGAVELNEGLRSIGAEAFFQSGLGALHVPASLQHMGRGALRETRIVFDGDETTFGIAAANPFFFRDEAGGLYRRNEDGVTLEALLSQRVARHVVREGTLRIAEGAYMKNSALEEAVLPEGLEVVGTDAFRGCKRLRSVNLPSTVRIVGDAAFVSTAVERLDIPARLETLGLFALDTGDGQPTTLERITVAPENPRFFMHGGLLCARDFPDGCSVRMASGWIRHIEMPEDALSCAPHAFTNLSATDSVHFNCRMRSIHPYAFPTQLKTVVRIDFEEEGRDASYVLVRDVARQMLSMASLQGGLDPRLLLHLRDREAALTYDKFDQARYALFRFAHPQFMLLRDRTELEQHLRKGAESLLVGFAEQGDLQSMDLLAEYGLLEEEQVTNVVEKVSGGGNTAATACLLDIKRRCFGGRRFDFSL